VSIELLAEAAEELRDYAALLDERQAGLGDKFVAEIEAALERIEGAPEGFPLLESIESGVPFRRLHVKRYRHLIVYVIDEGRPLVVAISHAHRDPSAWLGRWP
jgi:plasmid stabilization system protein ParE